jgi:hypothetical protein
MRKPFLILQQTAAVPDEFATSDPILKRPAGKTGFEAAVAGKLQRFAATR